MNPQQFQNMAGMGRGMPTNMQQMAMANQMGGQMPPQMGGQMGQMGGQMARNMPPQMAGQMSLNHPSVQQHIFDMLNSQGPSPAGRPMSISESEPVRSSCSSIPSV